jgi:hypothetical protein
MAYRDDADALRAHRDRLSAELEDARRAVAEASERAKSVKKLEADLAAVESKLAGFARSGRPGPSLEDVRIAAPCSASWDDMKGDDRVRFCGKCEKNVYNLSAMPRQEAEALLADRAGICVRLYKRADGTVLTEDCPVGVKRRRRVRLAIATVGGGIMAAATAAMMQPSRCEHTMGAMSVERAPEAGASPSEELVQGQFAEPMPSAPAPSVKHVMGRPALAPPAAASPRCQPGDPLCVQE